MTGNRGHSKNLPPLTQLERRVIGHLMTNIALNAYDEAGAVEEVAKAFDRDPSRFKQVLNRLARKGYLTMSGNMMEMVYPTVAALRQEAGISEKEAKRILAKISR